MAIQAEPNIYAAGLLIEWKIIMDGTQSEESSLDVAELEQTSRMNEQKDLMPSI
jgi:hypothetical protein